MAQRCGNCGKAITWSNISTSLFSGDLCKHCLSSMTAFDRIQYSNLREKERKEEEKQNYFLERNKERDKKELQSNIEDNITDLIENFKKELQDKQDEDFEDEMNKSIHIKGKRYIREIPKNEIPCKGCAFRYNNCYVRNNTPLKCEVHGLPTILIPYESYEDKERLEMEMDGKIIEVDGEEFLLPDFSALTICNFLKIPRIKEDYSNCDDCDIPRYDDESYIEESLCNFCDGDGYNCYYRRYVTEEEKKLRARQEYIRQQIEEEQREKEIAKQERRRIGALKRKATIERKKEEERIRKEEERISIEEKKIREEEEYRKRQEEWNSMNIFQKVKVKMFTTKFLEFSIFN